MILIYIHWTVIFWCETLEHQKVIPLKFINNTFQTWGFEKWILKLTHPAQPLKIIKLICNDWFSRVFIIKNKKDVQI